MPKSQLSIKAQIGVVLGVLMFFSVAITIAGFAASAQTSDKMAAFASDGAVVTGTNTKKYTLGFLGVFLWNRGGAPPAAPPFRKRT